ncbi:alpha/beta fold hydrolase [Metabacillus malikii]|uniref:Polyhydroxyalkanoate synthase n=1 Tax=Metabacillus malikii TaxID=1504265 RepID=A0ABT9ZKB0_9BACI|nr:alpha/beta fold hydrolase [Metabacillus malikii]MDQ0232724.1 polyhydroxyalkanoate synthase [Metabacillus malikii]
MANSNENKDLTNREIKRWQGYFSQWTEEPPQVGLTPKQAIWQKNKATLWYYPTPNKRFHTPIYIIYSFVNKPTLLDLGPNMSLIESFGKEGYDVYLIDFGIPGYEDKDMKLDDYISSYVQPGAKRALHHSNADGLTIIGFCLGGTLATIYTAIADEPIKNLILLATPIDFSTIPFLENWAQAIKDGTFDVAEMIDVVGLVPASAMGVGMRIITSPLYYSPQAALLQKSYDDTHVDRWRRLNMWSEEHIPLPGATLKQLIYEIGMENKLIKNKLVINNKRVSLKNIKANLYALSTTYDRLVPPEQLKPIMSKVSSRDKKFLEVDGGHANLALRGEIPDYFAEWLNPRS